MHEAASSFEIPDKKNNISDKSCRYTEAAGTYTDKVMPDIDYFTDKPVVQCDVSVAKNAFLDCCT